MPTCVGGVLEGGGVSPPAGRRGAPGVHVTRVVPLLGWIGGAGGGAGEGGDGGGGGQEVLEVGEPTMSLPRVRVFEGRSPRWQLVEAVPEVKERMVQENLGVSEVQEGGVK